MSESQGTQSSQNSSPTKVNDATSNKRVRKKQQPRASCWSHFTKYVTEDGENRASCKHCDSTYSMETGGSTTNLNNHLKTCLKKPRGSTFDSKQSELTFAKFSPESETTFSTWKFDEDAIRKALIHMIIVDELPFRIVEGEGFKLFLSKACPRFHLPSRFTVRKDCLDLFNSMKNLMKNSFGQDTSRICLTTDTWTSLQRVSYMVLTAHWIDEEWMLQKRIINFCPISAHRGENIGQALEKWLQNMSVLLILMLEMTIAFFLTSQQEMESLRLMIGKMFEELKSSEDLDVISITSKMREKYNKYWGDAKKINFLVYFANIFDPRHKMEFVNFGVKLLFPDIAADVMKTIDKELHCLFDEYSSISGRAMVYEGQSSIPTKDWLRKSKDPINLDEYAAELQNMEDDLSRIPENQEVLSSKLHTLYEEDET
ncbi:hypothetical protein V6N13_135234 [Hibiscus sabdariffa]